MRNGAVVVIGAGPAGLATAVQLARRRIPTVVLERGDAVGAAWRGRYDRLRLNSSRWFSQLPGARFDRDAGVFPSRDDMVRYLDAYAERHATDVRLCTAVERIDRGRGGFVLRTTAGERAADHVVVATGFQRVAHVPEWPGRERFTGTLLHAAAYRNPAPFRGRDVLVVGPGCSGIEIAYDLACCGAARVRLAVRTPPNILVRSAAGPLFARPLARLPPRPADAVARAVRRLQVGDLARFGLPEPEEGVMSRNRRLGVVPAIVDKPWIAAIRDGRVEVVGGVETLDETGVLLAGGARIEPDAVIAATGYGCGLELMVGHLGVLDHRGVPLIHGGAPAARGLRFVGYAPRPAQLGYLGGEAKVAADGIARELGRARRRTAVVSGPALDPR